MQYCFDLSLYFALHTYTLLLRTTRLVGVRVQHECWIYTVMHCLLCQVLFHRRGLDNARQARQPSPVRQLCWWDAHSLQFFPRLVLNKISTSQWNHTTFLLFRSLGCQTRGHPLFVAPDSLYFMSSHIRRGRWGVRSLLQGGGGAHPYSVLGAPNHFSSSCWFGCISETIGKPPAEKKYNN